MRTVIVTTFTSLTVLLLAGCAAFDLTKKHHGSPPECKIHKIEMHPDRIEVFGESVYDPGYVDHAQKHFPNHGGHLLNFEREGIPWNRDVIDFVCPNCDEAYKKYWNENSYNKSIE